MKNGLHIRRLEADEPAFEVVARWRYDAFFAQDGITFEESRDALRTWMDGLGYETALLAEVDGQPAGSCLFVREEIDPKHDLTPWLAALYVAPEFRGRSVATALVRAIEEHAHNVGCKQLYLYTIAAEPLYAKLGWTARDRFESNGEKFVLMRGRCSWTVTTASVAGICHPRQPGPEHLRT